MQPTIKFPFGNWFIEKAPSVLGNEETFDQIVLPVEFNKTIKVLVILGELESIPPIAIFPLVVSTTSKKISPINLH